MGEIEMVPMNKGEFERTILDIDAFVGLDVDRTIFKTDKFLGFLFERLKDVDGVDSDNVEGLHGSILARTGQTVDFLLEMRDSFGLAAVDEMLQKVTEDLERKAIEPLDLFYEGTEELLDYLKNQENVSAGGVRAGLWTKGAPDTQSLKLDLLKAAYPGHEMPAMITLEEGKAERANSDWYDGERFAIPDVFSASPEEAIRSRYLVVVDDKLINLESDNPKIIGHHINNINPETNSGTALKDFVAGLQDGSIPLIPTRQ